jgi:hypothetical protein
VSAVTLFDLGHIWAIAQVVLPLAGSPFVIVTRSIRRLLCSFSLLREQKHADYHRAAVPGAAVACHGPVAVADPEGGSGR